MKRLAAVFTASLLCSCAGFHTTPPISTDTGALRATAAATCAWKVVKGASGTSHHVDLFGVLSSGPNDAWAIGAVGAKSLAERWNGKAWKIVMTPNPGASYNALTGVAGTSASDIWAVGDYGATPSQERPLLMHWNGSVWKTSGGAKLPDDGYLFGVAAVSKNDYWAVGGYDVKPGQEETLIEHWNGTRWQIVPSPNAAATYNSLAPVFAFSANDVWAGGNAFTPSTQINQGITMHWDGKQWSMVAVPPPNAPSFGVSAFAGVSPSSFFTLGNFDDEKKNRYRVYADQLKGRTASWLNPLYAGGYDYGSEGTYVSNGAGVSASEAFAVGSYDKGGTSRTFAMRWDGSKWTVELTPNVGPYPNFLNGIGAIPGTKNVWAVGAAGSSTPGDNAGLIEIATCK